MKILILLFISLNTYSYEIKDLDYDQLSHNDIEELKIENAKKWEYHLMQAEKIWDCANGGCPYDFNSKENKTALENNHQKLIDLKE